MPRQPEQASTYKDFGVDIELGDDASTILFEAAKRTWKNREGLFGEIITPTDNFSAVRAIRIDNLPEGSIMGMNSDGVGTKMEMAERLGNHTTIAHDLLAMVCDDAAIRGVEPVLVATVLDVNSLGGDEESHVNLVRQLARGYIDAAEAAGVAVINGELAELGARVGGYGDFNYNWGATVTWIGREDRLLTGEQVLPGNAIVGFREKGFRANGLSLVRGILENSYGPEWHADAEGSKLAAQVLIPSQIYTRLLTDITGGFDRDSKAHITAAAHITGGGLPGKLDRIVGPVGLGARITEPMNPSDAMLRLQEMGNVTDEEAYRTWNMGQGMAIITPLPHEVISIANEFDIEASIIGVVTDQRGIEIVSKGHKNPGISLSF